MKKNIIKSFAALALGATLLTSCGKDNETIGVTDVFTTGVETGYAPVYFWTRVKRGCNVLAARMLICWRRLTKRTQEIETTVSGGTIYE